MFDPFGDFETRGYLRNFRKLKDRKLISDQERVAFAAFAPKAAKLIRVTQHISYADVLKTHEILFGRLYPWAGQDRSMTAPNLSISKAGIEDLFTLPGHEKLAMNHALHLGSNPHVMKAKPGEIMGLMAFSHPFLDGNGRTIMLLHQELCFRAGFHIDWLKTNKSSYLHILTEELKSPGKGFLDDYLRPMIVSRQLDLADSLKTLLAIPGLNTDVHARGEGTIAPGPRK